jgi:hypothetical protein
MSGHSELAIAIEEAKVLQDALRQEMRQHGECLYQLFLAERQIEQWRLHSDELAAENVKLGRAEQELTKEVKSLQYALDCFAKDLKAARHRNETADRLFIEQQAEVTQLKLELAAACVIITTAKAMSEEHQQCLNSQLTQRFGRD